MGFIHYAQLFFIFLNDIATDPNNPVAFDAIAKLPIHEGKSLHYPTDFTPLQKAKYPKLSPLQTSHPRAEVFTAAVEIAKKNHWEMLHIDQNRFFFEAIATTKWLRFRDDIAFEVRQNGENTLAHMRSRSRVGQSDFGANAKRISRFLESLKKTLGN